MRSGAARCVVRRTIGVRVRSVFARLGAASAGKRCEIGRDGDGCGQPPPDLGRRNPLGASERQTADDGQRASPAAQYTRGDFAGGRHGCSDLLWQRRDRCQRWSNPDRRDVSDNVRPARCLWSRPCRTNVPGRDRRTIHVPRGRWMPRSTLTTPRATSSPARGPAQTATTASLWHLVATPS
jgi:hypothetical protein